MNVKYKGMTCKLLKYYISKGDGPYVMIINSYDIKKAYEMGFDCLGYPTEIAKKISIYEYHKLKTKAYIRGKYETIRYYFYRKRN